MYPEFHIWIGPDLICALACAFYNIFIKKGSVSIYLILGGVILQFVSAIFCLILSELIILYNKSNDNNKALHHDKDGLFWAICTRVAVRLLEMLSSCVNRIVSSIASIDVYIAYHIIL